MNVFVLCVGRCGSVTFTNACSHITNYTAAHESRCIELGEQRLAFPDNHIEVDNRLAWFLGRLEQQYGDSAVYVHLRRNSTEIAESYNRRWTYDRGIMSAYAKGILQSGRVGLDVSHDLVQTVTENIEFYLRNKTKKFVIDIESPEVEFRRFWDFIGAEGDVEQALSEFKVRHNPNIFLKDETAPTNTGVDFVIRQFEEQRDKLQQQLKLTKKEHADIAKKLVITTKETNALRAELKRVQAPFLVRLKNAIIKNSRPSDGRLKVLLAILRVIYNKFLRLIKKKKATKSAVKKHVLWNAYLLAQQEGWQRALDYAELNADGNERNALHLLRANLTESDKEWLAELNAYLEKYMAGTSLTLKEENTERFFRLSAASSNPSAEGPLVSVIMPAFNAEKTLRLAAESILNQSRSNLELIIIDDCSNDATYRIACELAEKDKRVKVLKNSVNVGPYVSKNFALRFVRGEYVTGQDADDWSLPTRIENELKVIEQSCGKTRAVLSSMIRIRETGQFPHFSKVMASSPDGANRVASISLFIETTVLRETLGGWDSVRFGADSELIARAKHYLGDAFSQTNHVGMICLDHESSLTNHVTHGVDRVHGVSSTRSAYREAWQAWHNELDTYGYFMPFPQQNRFYQAPEVMQVSVESVEKCLDKLQ